MRFLSNQRGDAFILSLVVLAVSGLIFLASQGTHISSTERVQLYRIRSQMNILEQNLRFALAQPQAYQGCQSTAGGSRGCTLNSSFLKAFEDFKGVGLPCEDSSGKQCGFKIRNWSLNQSKLEVKVDLEFVGSSQLHKSSIVVQIPEEIMQAQVFSCPALSPTTPVFSGIDPNTGQIKCRSIPRCVSGEYMTGIDRNRVDALCSKIPTDTVACGPGQMISSFKWKGTSFASTCKDRLDPFSHFGGL